MEIFFERTFYLLYIILLAKINIQSRKSIFPCFSCSNILRSFWVEGEWGKMIWHDHQEKGGSRVVQNMIAGLEGTKIWLQDVSPVEMHISCNLVTIGARTRGGTTKYKIDHNTLNFNARISKFCIYQGVSKEWPINFQKNVTQIRLGPFFWEILDKIMCSEPKRKTWFTKLVYINYWVRAILSRNFSPNSLAKIGSGPIFWGKNWWDILLRYPGK